MAYLVLGHEFVEVGSPLVALDALVATLVLARTLLRTALGVDHAVDTVLSASLAFILRLAVARLRLVQHVRLHVVVHVCHTTIDIISD